MVERVTFVAFLAILAPKPHSISAQRPLLAPQQLRPPLKSLPSWKEPLILQCPPLDSVGGSDLALGVQPPRKVRETQPECQVPRANTPHNDIIIIIVVIHVTHGQYYSLIFPIKPYTVTNCATGV